MKRLSLLACSQIESALLPSAIYDLHKMHSHLISPIGGAWKPSEIWVHPNLDSQYFQLLIEQVIETEPDYFLFYWCGHGVLNTSGALELTFIDGVDIPLADAYCLVPQQLIIADTCRCLIADDSFELLSGDMTESWLGTKLIRDCYRSAFESYLTGCGPGVQIAYSCQQGEKAYCNEKGSSYSTYLLREAAHWRLPSGGNSGYATIPELAKDFHDDRQQADYYYNNSCKAFPFSLQINLSELKLL